MAWSVHNPAYDTPEYRAAREACLARAVRCALAFPSVCTGKPTQADHVEGIDNDPEHKKLQAVCRPCHRVKTAAEATAGRRGGKSKRDPGPISRTRW